MGRLGQVGQGEPAADRHREEQERAAEGRAQRGRRDRAAAAGGDGDARRGEHGGRDGQPETGDFEHVVSLPEPVQLVRREHGDLGVLDRDAVRQRDVVVGEVAFDLRGDRGQVDGDRAVAPVVEGVQHGAVERPVARVPRRVEGLAPGERAHRVVHEGAQGALLVTGAELRVEPWGHLLQDPGPYGVRHRALHGRIGGQRRHRGDVAAGVGEPVRHPGRQRAERHEEARQGDQRCRQGVPQTGGHLFRQGSRGWMCQPRDCIRPHDSALRWSVHPNGCLMDQGRVRGWMKGNGSAPAPVAAGADPCSHLT
ncbi:putative Integral membrane protein [Streptomyces viridochromogenes Tue57]|uniref:Putative Integral membrane protein n=1 Tax=Streptomyces viridochromogenes Tue57 TaxID=1160705 RepID=L8PFE1_STRVR|nr:putative Integral membrane protein [Streptomyces viridochromogenes Tue57]